MARTIRLRSQTHVPEMALLGKPSARFPNECRLRTVISSITDPRARARPSSSCCCAAAGLARCDATDAPPCADAPKGLPAALCVCCTSRPSPATKYRSLSRPLPLSVSPPSLLFFPLLPPLYTRNPLPPTYPTPTHITMSTRSTRKRKNEEEELVELPEDSDAESEEE